MSIREKIHAVNPYEGFKAFNYLDLQGWNGDGQVIQDLVREVKPKLIVEVGSWKGQSAATMGALVKGSNCEIVCVDTWLGAAEFWTDQDDPDRYKSLKLVNGYPSVYYQFLSNMVQLGLQNTVTPFPQSSLIAARLLRLWDAEPQLIYIDASHQYDDVMADLKAYWPLVQPGGVMFGDDYHPGWPGVVKAVKEFSDYFHLEVRDRYWILRKPAAA